MLDDKGCLRARGRAIGVVDWVVRWQINGTPVLSSDASVLFSKAIVYYQDSSDCMYAAHATSGQLMVTVRIAELKSEGVCAKLGSTGGSAARVTLGAVHRS